MKNKKYYEDITNTFVLDVENIERYIFNVNDFLISSSKSFKEKYNLTKEDLAFLKKHFSYLENIEGYREDNSSGKKVDLKTAKKILTWQFRITDHFEEGLHIHYLWASSLVYLIAIFEDYLKKYLLAFYSENPKYLSTSSKQMTYEEVLSYSNINDIFKEIAAKEVNSLFNKNIDEVIQTIEKRHKVKIASFGKWNVIRESIYRRNLVVHNNSIVDKQYFIKIKECKIGEHVSTNIDYIGTVLNELMSFASYFNNAMSNKFKL